MYETKGRGVLHAALRNQTEDYQGLMSDAGYSVRVGL